MRKITVCMGSSCFARENRDNLALIEEYLESNALTNIVKLEGTLCMGVCGEGPNISIDGVDYHKVMPSELISILDTHRQSS